MIARYEYDALNRRTKEFINADTDDDFDSFRHFYYTFGWQLLETRLSSSENTGPETLQPEYQYVWSVRYIDAAVLRDKNTDSDDLCDDERLYYLTDANMNVTCLVEDDGDVAERYVYDPYGNVKVYSDNWSTEVTWAASKKNNIRFCGYYFDNETGLCNPRTRYYHPPLGRSVTRDQDYYDGMNSYEYVRSRPTTIVDPWGLYGFETHFVATWWHAQLAVSDAIREQRATWVDTEKCAPLQEEIAKADQACDDDARNAFKAVAERNVENYNLHFPGATFNSEDLWPLNLLKNELNPVLGGLDANALVRQMVREAVEDCNVTWMGEALHALQDSFAHKGKPTPGHPKRKILVGARWDPATMLFATEIEGNVGGTWVEGGGLLDTQLDDPRYDPHRHADALADTRRALKEFWDACLCTLCGPGASEKKSGE